MAKAGKITFEVEINIADETRAALVALGWKPPATDGDVEVEDDAPRGFVVTADRGVVLRVNGSAIALSEGQVLSLVARPSVVRP